MDDNSSGFYAYASLPAEIGQTIEQLNLNVTYYVGYAIGKGKRVLLTENKSIQEGNPTITEVGILDTLGFKEYQNSTELTRFLNSAVPTDPLSIPKKINFKSPEYLLEGMDKTDLATRIVSRTKKARFLFRSFDSNEQPMLSANDAISQVAQSQEIPWRYGVDIFVYLVTGILKLNRKPKFISLFSGAGGLDCGLEAAGFQCALAVEKSEICRETYCLNFPKVKLSSTGAIEC